MQVFAVGEYEDGVARNSTFAEGDWNTDGDFTTDDLVLAFQLGGYSSAAMPVANEYATDIASALQAVLEEFELDGI